MTDQDNTLFLRLAGPMQSWGTSSRFQLRRTDGRPSKSGVLGLLLCAMGVPRKDSAPALEPLNALRMGVRVDRAGEVGWDYHTVGAKSGIRTAGGGVKRTAATGELETLLSRRQYLYDASFLVALQGDGPTVTRCAAALDQPVWPVYLGRKCCVPGEPVAAGTGRFGDLADALCSIPWRPRVTRIDGDGGGSSRELTVFLEHPPGSPPPQDAVAVYDAPRGFGYYNYAPRWVVAAAVTAPVAEPTHPRPERTWSDPYGPEWPALRAARLEHDRGLCVFCKSPAVDVHHTDYDDVRLETLRSLCKLCHDACTMLEYSGEIARRVDPADPEQRQALLEQIHRMLEERRLPRRRELLEAGRAPGKEAR